MTSPQPYALPPKPGKYHIVNVQTGTVIEVPHYNQERSVSGIWKDKPNQHWFVQRSGCGYKIKNCQYGVYLAASSSKEGTVVGASDKATVWNLARTHGGFAIQYENEDRAINLHFAHAGDNNILLLWGFGELKDHRRWKFQRISDDVGGEKADPIEDENHQLRRELTEKTAQLALQEEELAKKCQEIVEKDRIIAAQAASLHQIGAPQCTTSKMVEINARLDQLDQIVRQTRTIMDGLRLE